MRRAPVVELSETEIVTLKRWSRGRRTPTRLVLRANIVLLAADGLENSEIAAKLATSRQTVGLWRKRFARRQLPGIEKDAPRGAPLSESRRILERQIVEKTTQEKPDNATDWSTRSLAKELGTSRSTVHRTWRAHGLKPHLVRTFKLSTDPNFVEKLKDVVGLYLNPPKNAWVLSVDEKSQIQALDRTQPGLPLKRGRCGTMTHDYKRHGTTTLFAAIDMTEGRVIYSCMPRHRHQEWIMFLSKIDRQTPKNLDLHLTADNYSTHKHPAVRAWLDKHRRFHMHFIPTSSSWLNVIERFFSELTTKCVRRGAFSSVSDLLKAMEDFIAHHNADPKPYVWTAQVEKILNKIGRARISLDKIKPT
jgi:transposase